MTNVYAGIGSRKLPEDIKDQMIELGSIAGTKGWTLRSGAARGADSAFEEGCDTVHGKKEIYLPWTGFNNRYDGFKCAPSLMAYKFASAVHPKFDALSIVAKKLIARNMHQILGDFLNDPVDFVICWTPDGCDSSTTYTRHTGGTGSAIALACYLEIPVYNLKHKIHNLKTLFT